MKLASWSRKPCPGSPPRRRGKASFSGTFRPGVGITPAQAGKSRRLCPSGRRSKDHPRAGGEKAAYLRAVCGPRGSPPRRRGKGSAGLGGRDGLRITPAQAGKSFFGAAEGITGQDHPRAGGEKVFHVCRLRNFQGSPPRRRGKVDLVVVKHRLSGITPAQAGKSFPAGCQRSRSKDHPRAGGEKSVSAVTITTMSGSPPRRRGKDSCHQLQKMPFRITPAQAGKSRRMRF